MSRCTHPALIQASRIAISNYIPANTFPLYNGHPAHFSPAETPRLLTAETAPRPARDAPHYIDVPVLKTAVN